MQSEAALSREAAILVELRDRYERDRNYVEADIAKRRLEDLRQHEEARRGETLRSRQVAQRLGIEESHMIEFQQFNAMWDRTMKEYEERAGELLEAMRQRHEIDVRELLHTKSSRAPTAIKQSPKLLDLRRIEETLAKQGDYVEAHETKLRADRLEAAEQERAVEGRAQQLAKAEAAFLQRQEQEVNALRQRIQTGAEEQRVARQQDLERLLRRYHNIKAELESQQRTEAMRERRGLTSLPGALGSRSSTRAALAMESRTRAAPRDSPSSRPASASASASTSALSSSRPKSARAAR